MEPSDITGFSYFQTGTESVAGLLLNPACIEWSHGVPNLVDRI
ncbi:hypothetical protein [Bacillus inaquosorum]